MSGVGCLWAIAIINWLEWIENAFSVHRGSLHCPGKPFAKADRRSGLFSPPGRSL